MDQLGRQRKEWQKTQEHLAMSSSEDVVEIQGSRIQSPEGQSQLLSPVNKFGVAESNKMPS